MKQDDYCSLLCPYLRKVPKSKLRRLPFYCDLYCVFLGVENDHVCRCERCLGKALNAAKDGFHLISTYPNAGVDKRKTKWGFRRLPLSEKNRFVRLVEQSGVTMGVDADTPLNTAHVLRLLGRQMDVLTVKETPAKTAETLKFESALNKLSDDMPRAISAETKQLLLNVFAVLDNSEKALMTSLISDSKKGPALVGNIARMPKSDNLLKDVRRMLADEWLKMEQEEERRRRRVLLQRLMDGMVANRKKTNRTKVPFFSTKCLIARGCELFRFPMSQREYGVQCPPRCRKNPAWGIPRFPPTDILSTR